MIYCCFVSIAKAMETGFFRQSAQGIVPHFSALGNVLSTLVDTPLTICEPNDTSVTIISTKKSTCHHICSPFQHTSKT